MVAIPFRDGSNNLLYANTASGTGSQNDPLIWEHTDPNVVQTLGNPSDITANVSSLNNTPATNYSLIQLTKLIAVLTNEQLEELIAQGNAIGNSNDATGNASTLASASTTPYNLIQLNKLIAILANNQLTKLTSQASAIGDGNNITANPTTLENTPTTSYSLIQLAKLIAVQSKPINWSVYTNFGSSVSGVIKNSTGYVRSLICKNDNIATRYIQLFNSASAPTTGAIPIISIPIAPDSTEKIGADIFGELGINFPTGISFGFSTSLSPYTAGSVDHSTQVIYR